MLSVGGTVKGGKIIIQGNNRNRIMEELIKMGFKVKRVGG
jgi:translation initiation factor 1